MANFTTFSYQPRQNRRYIIELPVISDDIRYIFNPIDTWFHLDRSIRLQYITPNTNYSC
jgi:hypothetical protein